MSQTLHHYSEIDFIKGVLILLALGCCFCGSGVTQAAEDVRGSASYRPRNAQTLWYLQPAESHGVKDAWMEYYLPLGNGHLGAMVGGGVECERVQLNEKTLWDGSATIYGNYQNLGYLYIEDQRPSAASDYHFALDLTTATAEAEWRNAGGVSFRREYLCSWPSRCLVIHQVASEAGAMHLLVRLEGTHDEQVRYDGVQATMQTRLTALSATTIVQLRADGGARIRSTQQGLMVTEATELTIVLAAETNYAPATVGYVALAAAAADRAKQRALAAAGRNWQALREEHQEDYGRLFGRMDFSLEGARAECPTDELVTGAEMASESERKALEMLVFAYGRYLAIASSRDGAVPSNLQGIWCNSNTPPWHCAIISDINVQMNYWPAEPANLGETAMPLLDYVYTGAMIQPYWREYTRRMTGIAEGWVCSFVNTPMGHGDPWYPEHSCCATPAWLCWHLWQHYVYSQDRDFLRQRALPVMLGAVDFWMRRLVRDGDDGLWVAPQEWSPEQGPLDDGTPHTQQCVWNLFDITLKALDIVGAQAAGLPNSRLTEIRRKFSELDKGLHTERYTGAYGSEVNGVRTGDLLLREWKHQPYTVAAEPRHRHVSHLMCVYPFDLLGGDEALTTAARNSMLLRGERGTGWSMAWKLCLWARMGDGAMAYEVLRSALKHAATYNVSTDPKNAGFYCNLLCAHPPFQIDGNFGTTAGLAEMLLQSQGELLRLLPALPEAWAAGGEVRGLRAEGAFEVDMRWDAEVTGGSIRSLAGSTCRLQTGEEWTEVRDAQGQLLACNEGQPALLAFPTTAGVSYTFMIGQHGERAESGSLMASKEDTEVYDLAGRRATAPRPGAIYVRGGRKIRIR